MAHVLVSTNEDSGNVSKENIESSIKIGQDDEGLSCFLVVFIIIIDVEGNDIAKNMKGFDKAVTVSFLGHVVIKAGDSINETSDS